MQEKMQSLTGGLPLPPGLKLPSELRMRAGACRERRDRAPDPAPGTLPGLGPRSARRAALHLVKKKEQLLARSRRRSRKRDASSTCETCGNIDTVSPARSAATRAATAR